MGRGGDGEMGRRGDGETGRGRAVLFSCSIFDLCVSKAFASKLSQEFLIIYSLLVGIIG